MKTPEQNPYAAPSSFEPKQPDLGSDNEQIRKKYLSHEASVQSFGLLFLLGSIIVMTMGIGNVVSVVGSNSSNPGLAVSGIALLLVSLFIGAIAVLQAFVGIGLRRLDPWSRFAAMVFAAVGLFVFPIGTIINGYLLYLLLCKKGQYVFSVEYAQVRAATPHIKYKTSIIVWIFLSLLLGVILLGLIGVFFG